MSIELDLLKTKNKTKDNIKTLILNIPSKYMKYSEARKEKIIAAILYVISNILTGVSALFLIVDVGHSNSQKRQI